MCVLSLDPRYQQHVCTVPYIIVKRIGINDVAGCGKKYYLHYVRRAKINGKLKICGKAGKSLLAASLPESIQTLQNLN
jgi:hypothetical protein